MRTYLVKYEQDENSLVINDRIRNSGSFYALSDCEFLVQSELHTAKELYDQIVKDDFKTLTVLVIALDAKVEEGYWGMSKKDLWEWLKSSESSH